jgi:hypothetical protein
MKTWLLRWCHDDDRFISESRDPRAILPRTVWGPCQIVQAMLTGISQCGRQRKAAKIKGGERQIMIDVRSAVRAAAWTAGNTSDIERCE